MGLSVGQVPIEKINDEFENEETKKEAFPESRVFGLEDLKLFYKDFAMHDNRIKQFVE